MSRGASCTVKWGIEIKFDIENGLKASMVLFLWFNDKFLCYSTIYLLEMRFRKKENQFHHLCMFDHVICGKKLNEQKINNKIDVLIDLHSIFDASKNDWPCQN